MSRVTPSDDAALAAELLRRGHPLELRVAGTSMWPLVTSGDRVRLEPGWPLRAGQIVAVHRSSALVVHRILRVEADRVLLRGDNAAVADAPVTRAEVLATVTAHWWWRGTRVDHTTAPMRALDRLAAALSRSSARPWGLLRRAVRWREGRRARAAATPDSPEERVD